MRFDVHAHAMYPVDDPDATSALMKHEGFSGQIPGTGWSVEGAIQFMDERDIAMQLLSTPSTLDAAGARTWNERTAGVVAAHPNRFGLLAALPLGDPDAAVQEIDYAAATLNAEGFVVPSNVAGVYHGAATLEPVFAAIETAGLPVFVHPALPPAFDRLGLGRPGPLIEYPMDTARTVVDALFAGLFLHHPGLRMVLAHAGGVLPTLRDRVAMVGTEPWTANPLNLTGDQIREQLASLYLDTAIAGGVASLAPAVAMVGLDHVLFGTDYPPAGLSTIDQTLEALDAPGAPTAEADFEAAFAALFPRASARAKGATPPEPATTA